MNWEEMITTTIMEFLDIEVHPDTGDLDFMAKIEIVKKRMADRIKHNPDRYEINDGMKNFEYEMFFKSRPNDKIRIDGWLPIETSKINEANKIEEYIEKGILREIVK